MVTTSQILTIVGLFFELLSVAYTARRVFSTRSKKKRKEKYIEEISRTVDQKLESRAREWYIVLGLLLLGVILQGLAVFV
jgi:hypothetical protein